MVTKHVDSYFHSGEQNVLLEECTPQPAYPEHDHEFDEIAIVLAGHGRHVCNETTSLIGPGSVLYLRAGEDWHGYDDVNALSLVNVQFRATPQLRTIQAMLRQHTGSIWRISQTTQRSLGGLLGQLRAGNANTDPLSCCKQEGLLIQLAAQLLQDRNTCASQGGSADRVRQLIEWLNGHYAETIDWEELAERHCISERTLRRKLHDHTGMSPQQYLTWLRLEHASERLRHGGDSVTQIAIDCGFADSNHFSTQFRHQFGASPSAWRRQQPGLAHSSPSA